MIHTRLVLLLLLLFPLVVTAQRNKEGKRRSRIVTSSNPSAYLSALELQLLEELNTLRTNPAAYLYRLEQLEKSVRQGDFTVGTTYRYMMGAKEGVGPIEEAITHLRAVVNAPLKPVAPVYALAVAAQDYTGEADGASRFGDPNAKGQAVWQVVEWKGNAQSKSMNSFATDNAVEIILQLLIDEGVPGRGHRKLLLDSSFTMVGVATETGKSWQRHAVILLATGSTEAR